jgi:hypothetical protein
MAMQISACVICLHSQRGADVVLLALLQMGQAVACNGAAAFSEYVAASAKLCQPVQQAGPQEVALVLSAVTACAALEVGW